MSLFLPFEHPHVVAQFLKRRQRFLAEIALSENVQVTAYCPNPGSLNGCTVTGAPALVNLSEDTKRRRAYTWRGIKLGRTWVGTDTHFANRLAKRAIQQSLLPGFEAYEISQTEVKVGPDSRLDFLLAGENGFCFIEVKSATVVEYGIARYPDSITPRALKHLKALEKKSKEGHRAVLFFVIQRGDAKYFALNHKHYPEYTRAYRKAIKNGVEIIAMSFEMTPKGFKVPKILPIVEIN